VSPLPPQAWSTLPRPLGAKADDLWVVIADLVGELGLG
jgi:hypothetical protein